MTVITFDRNLIKLWTKCSSMSGTDFCIVDSDDNENSIHLDHFKDIFLSQKSLDRSTILNPTDFGREGINHRDETLIYTSQQLKQYTQHCKIV